VPEATLPHGDGLSYGSVLWRQSDQIRRYDRSGRGDRRCG